MTSPRTYGESHAVRGPHPSVPPQAKLGVIGANGMGKSTLMKIIMGKETADSGDVEIGSTVQMRFLDQSRTVLDDEKPRSSRTSPTATNSCPSATSVIDSRAYLARFNFKGEDQQRKVGECSGGQRNRVMLAKMLREPANLIIMDEPTNDLDLDTLRVLEEAIEHYPGSMIIVTHDRYFLNRVATHILSFEGPGEDGTGVVHFHHGDYESFKDWKKLPRRGHRRGGRRFGIDVAASATSAEAPAGPRAQRGHPDYEGRGVPASRTGPAIACPDT